MELMEELEKQRLKEGLTMSDFADLLGVSKGYYSRVRSHSLPMGDRLRTAALRRYPWLATLVLKSLSEPEPEMQLAESVA